MGKEKEKHLFVKDVAEGLDFKLDSLSLLLDLKVLLKEYYAATFSADERGLVVSFNNGQKFKICVEELE